MRKINMADFLPVHTKIPSDAHPATIAARSTDDDLPTRAGISTATKLYAAWSRIEDTLGQLKDQRKAEAFVMDVHGKALKEADQGLKYLRDHERALTDAITKTVGTFRRQYAAELRQHYAKEKAPFSALLSDISNPDVAAAIYDVPTVLLGSVTPEQHATLISRIEEVHANKEFRARNNARLAIGIIDRAKEDFHAKQMKRLVAFENSDEKILAKARKEPEAA